ncbi:hypothetical protein [Egicoccus halophilus]|uniref:Uncharacterized protein n=1 Tax=Egicoccus halophilus TaxID=1670830 RepID=A0A8J3A7J1_9ACTN|nr:hypothetical protein [Egicoccus halophilus]GGI02786.1 hypothetical protein GCM10011354_01540 [Egicoccus halophilus]
MRRRWTTCLSLALMGMLLGALPAAAQSADAEALLIAPSVDEFCTAIEELAAGADPEELAELVEGDGGQWAAMFAPEPIDRADVGDVADNLEELLAESDGDVASASHDGMALVVTLLPDPTQCEGFADWGVEEGEQMEPGAYLIAPSADEFCAAVEELFEELLADEGAMEDAAPGDDLGVSPAVLEAFEPDLIDLSTDERYAALADAMSTTRTGYDADVLSVTTDGESVLVVALPDLTDCDLGMDDVPVDGVEAGFGGAASDNVPPIALLLLGLGAGALALGVRTLRTDAA